jgi:hypothetical protein
LYDTWAHFSFFYAKLQVYFWIFMFQKTQSHRRKEWRVGLRCPGEGCLTKKQRLEISLDCLFKSGNRGRILKVIFRHVVKTSLLSASSCIHVLLFNTAYVLIGEVFILLLRHWLAQCLLSQNKSAKPSPNGAKASYRTKNNPHQYINVTRKFFNMTSCV